MVDAQYEIRTLQLKILISQQEKDWLVDLADELGLTVSDVVRQFIRAASKNAAKDREGSDPNASWVSSSEVDPATPATPTNLPQDD